MDKIDYKKKVEESRGRSHFLSEALGEKAKDWNDKRTEFSKEVQKIAAMEGEIKIKFENLMYEIKKYFSENGRPEIWTMDVGFDTDALKDDVYIINLTESR